MVDASCKTPVSGNVLPLQIIKVPLTKFEIWTTFNALFFTQLFIKQQLHLAGNHSSGTGPVVHGTTELPYDTVRPLNYYFIDE